MTRVINTLKAIAIVTVFATLITMVSYVECHYTQDATITALEEDDEVVFVDARGEEWSFFGEGYEVGQEVKATFYTNHTDGCIYDDVVYIVR